MTDPLRKSLHNNTDRDDDRAVVVYENFGAEEADAPPAQPPAERPVVLQHLARGVRAFVDRGLGADIVDDASVFAWLNTRGALAFADRIGRRLFGADPGVVDVVHDKGFCLAAQRTGGVIDARLDKRITVIDADDLDEGALHRAVAAVGQLDCTIKPRRGTSGRGRVHGLRPATWAGALPRLRSAGGVVVEPWLRRDLDLSSQWRVDDDGHVHFLASTRALTLASGVWVGCEVNVDDNGIHAAFDDHPDVDPDLVRDFVDRSFVVVSAAARAGYVGYCGVDGFAFTLGPHRGVHLTELNARPTAGLIGASLARTAASSDGHGRFRYEPARSADVVRVD